MISFRCPKCYRKHTARDQNAGRRGFCACGAVMLLPAPGSADGNQTPELIGEVDFDYSRRARLIIFAAFAIAIVVILVFAVNLYLRRAWERDNRSRLLSLNDEAKALVQAKQFEKAKLKYHELLALLSDHGIADGFLRDRMYAARAASAENDTTVDKIVSERTAASEEAEQQQWRDLTQHRGLQSLPKDDPTRSGNQSLRVTSDPTITNPPGPPRIGETRQVIVKCFGASSEEVLDRAVEIVRDKDDTAFARLIDSGELKPLAKGTTVTIEDTTLLGKARVRVRGEAIPVWIVSDWAR